MAETTTEHIHCRGCGRDMGVGVPTPEHCGECPPWQCDQCGQMCSIADTCPCWTSLEGMPLADIKALFADDCDGPGLSIETPRGVDRD